MRIVVTKQVAEEATIIFDVQIDGCRDAVGIDEVTIQLGKLPISQIVDHESI